MKKFTKYFIIVTAILLVSIFAIVQNSISKENEQENDKLRNEILTYFKKNSKDVTIHEANKYYELAENLFVEDDLILSKMKKAINKLKQSSYHIQIEQNRLDSIKTVRTTKEQTKDTPNKNYLVDIKQIINKPVSEVTTLLGKPESSEKTKYGIKQIYKEGRIEIVFKENIPLLITINNIDKLTSTGQLGMLRLPNSGSYNYTAIGKRWENIHGLSSISYFTDEEDNLDHIYIVVSEY